MQILSPEPKETSLPLSKNTPMLHDPLARIEINAKPPSPEESGGDLPDEIKKIFAMGDDDFSQYIKNKPNEKEGEENKRADPIMDEWDKALLLGEYPKEVEKRRIILPGFSPDVPQKSAYRPVKAVFPTRIIDEVAPILKHTQPETEPITKHVVIPNTSVPKKPTEQKTALPASPAKMSIPIKPKPSPETIPPKTGPEIPQPSAAMSEALVEKISIGQITNVLKNAPPTLQNKFEKIPVQTILAPKNVLSGDTATESNLEDDLWLKKLCEYLEGIRAQAQLVFVDPKDADPKDGELMLDYVKRVYPITLKMRVEKQ